MKEIFDLEVLSKELEASEIFEDEDENKYQSIYLGSVYSVMPSGKYYMPFAHSNLDVCEKCNGSGKIDNPNKKTKSYNRAEKHIKQMIKKLSNGYWNMPEGYRNRLDLLRKRKAYYQPHIECPICGGCGFPEAYQDELWTAQAEKELESIEACLHYDGDDIFINKYI
jgi:hypothetical protein